MLIFSQDYVYAWYMHMCVFTWSAESLDFLRRPPTLLDMFQFWKKLREMCLTHSCHKEHNTSPKATVYLQTHTSNNITAADLTGVAAGRV